MAFKLLRLKDFLHLIYSPITLIHENHKFEKREKNDFDIINYADYEVIGIRSGTAGEVIISVKRHK